MGLSHCDGWVECLLSPADFILGRSHRRHPRVPLCLCTDEVEDAMKVPKALTDLPPEFKVAGRTGAAQFANPHAAQYTSLLRPTATIRSMSCSQIRARPIPAPIRLR